MELIEQLSPVAKETGTNPSEEELRDHAEFCARTEEHIFLGEANMIAEELATAIANILRLNQFDTQAKQACTFLRMLIIGRCAKENPELAQKVERMLIEIAATLAPSPVYRKRKSTGGKLH